VSKRKPGISRRDFVGVSIGAVVIAGVGCGSSDNKQTGAGGQPGAGGNSTNGTGSSTGGAGSSAGGAGSSTGGAGIGGANTGAGGAATGGANTGAGGAATGGANTGAGGAATGGKSNGAGGAATGGKSSGAGGAATGGSSAAKGGASATGGANPTGGTTAAGGAVATGGTSAAGTDGTPLVALVRDTDVATATMAAIAKIGLPDLKGKKVIIRPNEIEGKLDGTTNPEVIRGIIRAIKAASSGAPTSIVVAEDAFSGNGAIANMQTNGVAKVCTDEGGATTMDLSGTATTNRKPTNAAAWTNGIDFYNTVYDADYVINAPRCKTHGIANFSMALKAWFGSLKRPSDLHTGIMNRAPEAHLARKEDLVVLDASRCMISGGPTAGGTMKDSNVIVASKDAIAADVTGIAIIRYNGGTLAAPWTQAQIKRALAIAVPGWLTAQTDFTYWSSGVTEIADIMAKRT